MYNTWKQRCVETIILILITYIAGYKTQIAMK